MKGISNPIPSKARIEIVAAMYSRMIDYQTSNVACHRLIEKFPSLRDNSLSGNGIVRLL